MKTILITAPVYSQSGYGEHARTLISAIRYIQDKSDIELDIYLNATGWAKSLNLDDFDDYEWCRFHESKLAQSGKRGFDVSLQVAPVHEFSPICPVNIGFTALVETDKVSEHYIDKINSMTEVVVLSQFNLDTLQNSIYQNKEVKTNISVANYVFSENDICDLELNISTSFNFLTVCQISERKDFTSTVQAFLESFKNNEDVGLVCKIHKLNGSTIDRYAMSEYLKNIKNKHSDSKCKLYLLHGDMTKSEMFSLYNHEKINCFVTSTRGESWGLPIFESACSGLPVIAPNYSGYRDFLVIKDDKNHEKNMFLPVKYNLTKLHDNNVWEQVLIKGSSWANVDVSSLKRNMMYAYKDYNKYKSLATKLKNILKETYSKQSVYSRYYNIINKYLELEDDKIMVL